RDVEIVGASYDVGPRRSLRWRLTLRNRSRVVAFRDVLYITTYRDRSGAIADQRHEFVKDIFEPGAVSTVEVNDGFVRAPFTRATIELGGREATGEGEKGGRGGRRGGAPPH